MASRATAHLALKRAVVVALLAAGVVVATRTAEAQQAPTQTESARYRQSARSAAEHFAAGRFEQALRGFREALRQAPPEADRATLQFNVAASLYELSRFDEAEPHFLSAAVLDPGLAPLATLDAGMSAFRAGRIDDASRHYQAAPPGDSLAEQRRAELGGLLEAAKREQRTDERHRLFSSAADAMADGRYAEVLTILARAEPLMTDASAQERSDLWFARGRAAYELGNVAAARAHFAEAQQLSPNDAELEYWRARAAQADGDEEAAQAGFDNALGLGLTGKRRDDALARRTELDPLPPRGWSGWLAAGGGYDTNPLQSGLAETVATGSTGSGQGRGRQATRQTSSSGSALITASGGLAHTLGLGRNWALEPHLGLDWLALLAEPARELSLMSQQLGVRVHFAPSRAWRLRAGASGGLMWVGLEEMEPLAWQVKGELRADWHAGISRTRLEGSVAKVTGLSGYDYFGGTVSELSLAERLTPRPVAVELQGRLRHYDIGVQRLELTADSYPSCAACAGQEYVIPLGYVEPGVQARLEVDVGARLMLGAMAGVGWRSYSDESFITGVPESTKQREDRRLQAGALVEVALNASGSALLVGRYDVLWSESNMALDPNDPDHALDYEDRSYAQHVVELGFELYF